MILLKLNWTSCSRSKRCINNWSSELWHAKSSNFTFCEEKKKHFFERENIKRIKNKEGKNGRDVNHKEKPKESFSFFLLCGYTFTVWTWAIGHSQNQRSCRCSLYAGDFFRSPCGQNKSAGIFTPNCMAFLFICHYNSKVVGLLTLLKG